MRRYTDRCTGLEMVDYGMGFVPAAGIGQLFQTSQFAPLTTTQFPKVLPIFCEPGYVPDGNRCVPAPPTKSWDPGVWPDVGPCDWAKGKPESNAFFSAIQAAVRYHGKATTARALDSIHQGGQWTVAYFPDKDLVARMLGRIHIQDENLNVRPTFGERLVDCALLVKTTGPIAIPNNASVTATVEFAPLAPPPPCPAGYTWGGSSCVPLPPVSPYAFTGR